MTSVDTVAAELDRRFHVAIEFHSNGDFYQAESIYRDILKDNPEMSAEVEKKIREKLAVAALS